MEAVIIANPNGQRHLPLQTLAKDFTVSPQKNTLIPYQGTRAFASWCHPCSEGCTLPYSAHSGSGCSGDFGAVRLIRRLGGCPSRAAPQRPCSQMVSSLPGTNAVLLPRHGHPGASAGHFYPYLTLFFERIIIRQSRSPRCKPRISISAEARFVAHGTLYVSHR